MFSACEPKLRSLRLQMSSVPSFSSSFPLFTAGLSRGWKRSVIGNCEISLIQRTGGLQLRITRTLKSTLHDLRFLKGGGISSNVWNRFENCWVFCWNTDNRSQFPKEEQFTMFVEKCLSSLSTLLTIWSYLSLWVRSHFLWRGVFGWSEGCFLNLGGT